MKEIKFVTGGWTDYFPLAGGIILIVGGLFVYYRKKGGRCEEKTR
jgi:LPXTG-motif cell wall-anchored protein